MAAGADDIANGALFQQRLLGDGGGLLVTDVAVERSHDRRGRLGVLAAALGVGLGTFDDSVREQPGCRGEQSGRFQHVARHHRHHHIDLQVAL